MFYYATALTAALKGIRILAQGVDFTKLVSELLTLGQNKLERS
jgi:hypothetical protein